MEKRNAVVTQAWLSLWRMYIRDWRRRKRKKKRYAIPYEPARLGCSCKYLRAGDNERQFYRDSSRANSQAAMTTSWNRAKKGDEPAANVSTEFYSLFLSSSMLLKLSVVCTDANDTLRALAIIAERDARSKWTHPILAHRINVVERWQMCNWRELI